MLPDRLISLQLLKKLNPTRGFCIVTRRLSNSSDSGSFDEASHLRTRQHFQADPISRPDELKPLRIEVLLFVLLCKLFSHPFPPIRSNLLTKNSNFRK
jgi:hypothetical protein